jgi:hypothetical protein
VAVVVAASVAVVVAASVVAVVVAVVAAAVVPVVAAAVVPVALKFWIVDYTLVILLFINKINMSLYY